MVSCLIHLFGRKSQIRTVRSDGQNYKKRNQLVKKKLKKQLALNENNLLYIYIYMCVCFLTVVSAV